MVSFYHKFQSHGLLAVLWIAMSPFLSAVYAQDVIFDEELRDGNLPTGWFQNEIDFQTAGGGYARFEVLNSTLTTPVFDGSAYQVIDVIFDVAKWGTGGDGPITVEYSLNGGGIWEAAGNSPIPESSTYLPALVKVPFTSDNMQVRFTRPNSASRKRLRDVVIQEGVYIIDFEGPGETKGSYASDDVNLSGLDWNLTEVLIGTSAADWKNGDRSARMRGYGSSSLSMIQDKAGGLGTISFQYRRYGTDAQVDWVAEYSTNGGVSWTQIGSIFTAPANDNVQTFSETVNVAGNIRIRIKRGTETGTVNRRLNIDDIVITDYFAPGEIDITGISAATFTQNDCTGETTGTVDFDISGAFSLANTFTAEISDADGNFAEPLVVGTLSGNEDGTINFTLPENMISGNGYRVRITSDFPPVIGTESETFSIVQTGEYCPDTDDYRSQGSGSWTEPGTWQQYRYVASSKTREWQTASAQPNSQFTSVFIESDHSVQLNASNRNVNHLIIANGGQLWRDGGNCGDLNYLNLHGDIWCDGTFGNGSTRDALGVNIQAGAHRIFGEGSFDAFRMRLSNETPNRGAGSLEVDMDITLHWRGEAENCSGGITPGTNAIYNDRNSNQNFDVVINAGKTLRIDHPGGGVGTMGPYASTGYRSNNAGGSYTIFGTLDCEGVVFLGSAGTASHLTRISVEENGRLNAGYLDYGINNNSGNFTGGGFRLLANSVLEITGTGEAFRNTDVGAISFTGSIGPAGNLFVSQINPTATVIYSASGNQSFPAFLPHPNTVFSGSGTKTFTPLGGPSLFAASGGITIEGSAVFNPSENTVELQGDWTNHGSAGFSHSGTTVAFTGAGAQLITCPGGEVFNHLELRISGEKTFNSEADFAVQGNLTLSGSAAVAANFASGLNITGNLSTSGSASWTESAFDNLDVRTAGDGNQTYTANGNPIRCYNFRSDKSGGSLTLGANTPVDAKNNFHIKRTGSSTFSDGGNEITLGDDLVLTGAASRFNFTGTIIMTGENGGTNDIGDEVDNGCLAELNHLTIKGSGTNNNTRVRPNGGHTLVIKGDLTIEDGTPGLPGLLDCRDNTIEVGGDWTNYDEAGFRERAGRVIFNGTGNQLITCPGGEEFYNLNFAESGEKTFNTEANFAVQGDLTLSGSAEVAANFDDSRLDITGNVSMSGSSSWTESAFDNLEVRTVGNGNQIFTANNNPIRCFNFRSDKSGGSLTLGTNTPIDAKNNFRVKRTGSSTFSDGGNEISLGDDLVLTGAASRFNFTGTIVMTGENGPSNDIGDEDDNGCLAELNHLHIKGSGTNNNTRVRPNGGHTLVIKGDVTIEDGTPGLPGLLDCRDNTIEVGGNWTNFDESGFREREGTVIFNGNGTQTITCPGGEVFYDLEFAGSGEKTFSSEGTYIVEGDLLKSGSAVTEATEEVTLELRGNLTMNDDSEWGDGAYDHLDIDARGNGNQTFAANDNPIRCFNFKAFKTGGSLDPAPGSPINAKNNVDLEMQGNALFSDNGNTITLGDDLRLKGNDSDRYQLSGTFVMTGEQGGTNNIQSEGNTAIIAELNNLLVNGSGANVTVDPLEGGEQTLFKGDVFVTDGLLNAQGNTLLVGGDWSTYGPAAFAEAGSTVNFNGTATQLIEGGGMQTFGRLEFSQAGNKNLAADLAVADDFVILEGSGTVNAGNAQISSEGNWINEEGTDAFAPGSGSVSFEGESPQEITTPGGALFFNAEIANNGGGILLNDGMTIAENGSIAFSNGIVHTQGNEVHFLSGADHSGASEFSYVSGYVRKSFSDSEGEFTFPVGDFDALTETDVFQPCAVIPSQAPPLGGEFRAAYFHENFTPGFENPNNRPPRDGSMESGTVSTCNYWIIEHPDGTPEFPARVRLTWGGSDCIEIQDNAFLTVARWNGLEWDNQAQTAVTGAPFSEGAVTSGIVSEFSPFAIGTSGADPNILPITLLSFSAEAVDNRVAECRWVTASEINNDYFTVERTRDGAIWEAVGTVPGAGNSNTALHYTFVDDDPFPGLSYYRLRQTDFDGTTETFDPRAVRITAGSEDFALHSVYREASSGIALVYKADAPYLTAEIYDVAGKLIHADLIENYGEHAVISARPARGVYLLRLSDNSGNTATKRFFY